MVTPDRSEFIALARQHRVIPVRRELLADQVTPVAVFRRLCGDGPGFLLESVDHGGKWGRWSFVGRRSLARIVSDDDGLHAEGDLPIDIADCNGMLDAVERILDECDTPSDPDLPPLHSGVVGYLGYDVVREVERLPNAPEDDSGWPTAALSIIGDLVALDHWSQKAIVITNCVIERGATDEELSALYDAALVRIDDMVGEGASPIDEPLVDPPRRDDDLPEFTSTMGDGAYEAGVVAAKELIAAGDVFQVVLAQRFDFDLDADPFDVYRVLRQINPSPYMYFVREPEVTLVGCSPEPMVQLLGDRVVSRPIAGTRFRGATEEADRRMAAELQEHPKERAEHVMLVDLARNDVGRVVEFGTCEVEELMTLERYSHVMHLTSQVAGTLRDGATPIDVLRATLPAGTVSGAPKVRAMEIIDEFEPTRRGPYAGIVGYLDFSGNIDTAIAIRTMIVGPPPADGGPRRASVQAGAGIVADSDPADERLETLNKAKALLSAVKPAERLARQRRGES